MSRGLIDLTGRRFGRLVVTGRVPGLSHKATIWRAACDCGKETTVRGDSLRRGDTHSCGCLRQEVSITRAHAARAVAASREATRRKLAMRDLDDDPQPEPDPPKTWEGARQAFEDLINAWGPQWTPRLD